MTIRTIARADALGIIGRNLQAVPEQAEGGLSVAFIAQALRRAVHILAPCPRHELEQAVVRSFCMFVAEAEELQTKISAILELLISYGDILEMRPFQDDPWSVASIILRPAPPSFVVRRNGTIIILGVAGDDISPLPGAWNARMTYHGVLRTIQPERGENVTALLSDIGMLQLTEKMWLHFPEARMAKQYLSDWSENLAQASASTPIEELLVIRTSQSPTYYAGRWVAPGRGDSGMHVARRPQKYGSPLWCLVDLDDGILLRFLDLASFANRERSCDLAWRVQMAMDAVIGTPQAVRVRESSVLDFFSPLPSWAERRLAVVGEREPPYRCLFSYRMPDKDVEDSLLFLKDHLWIAAQRDAERGK